MYLNSRLLPKVARVGLTVLLLQVEGACSEQKTSGWHPNIQLLDAAARTSQQASALAGDVKEFYQLLRDKRWHETYVRRAKAFQEDVLESDYIARAEKYESKWGLANYEVLSVEFYDSDVVLLVCKFTELPDYADAYSAVFWHREGGAWKCLSAGPKKLTIFSGTRPPKVDWR